MMQLYWLQWMNRTIVLISTHQVHLPSYRWALIRSMSSKMSSSSGKLCLRLCLFLRTVHYNRFRAELCVSCLYGRQWTCSFCMFLLNNNLIWMLIGLSDYLHLSGLVWYPCTRAGVEMWGRGSCLHGEHWACVPVRVSAGSPVVGSPLCLALRVDWTVVQSFRVSAGLWLHWRGVALQARRVRYGSLSLSWGGHLYCGQLVWPLWVQCAARCVAESILTGKLAIWSWWLLRDVVSNHNYLL